VNRFECLELLAPLITDHLVIASLSGQRVEWGHLCDHQGNLLVGAMGNALGIGLGLAIALPHRKVIALESDGSLLLSLYNLPTLANAGVSNLVVFVFDNQAYSGSRISHPTATAAKTDLESIARGSGIGHCVTVRNVQAFENEMRAALRENELRFIVCKVDETVRHREIQRTNVDTFENKYRFVRYIEETEGKPVFVGRG
jgi:sulfopyruvate decarboxylase subunit beta